MQPREPRANGLAVASSGSGLPRRLRTCLRVPLPVSKTGFDKFGSVMLSEPGAWLLTLA